MKKKQKVYLVLYSHRFGIDIGVYSSKKKQLQARKALEEGPDYEPERDESIELEDREVE